MFLTANPSAWKKMLELPVHERLAIAPGDLAEYVGRCNTVAGGDALRPLSAEVDASFVADLQQALAELPPAVVAMVEPRLLGVFLMSGIGCSAVTDMVGDAAGQPIGLAVALDVDVFRDRTANQWATWKDTTPFAAASGIRIETLIADAADDDRKGALQYVLLHEFGHVVSAAGGFVPDWWLSSASLGKADHSFLPISWNLRAGEPNEVVAKEDFPLRADVAYYAGNSACLSAEHAPALYADLARTSFATLYGATDVFDDFAECFATYVHAFQFGRRHETVVHREDKLVARFGDFWQQPCSQGKRAFFDALFARPASAWALPAPGAGRPELAERAKISFLGLAPFLRESIAGRPLQPIGQALLEAAGEQPGNPDLWMNLATALFSIELPDVALPVQAQALQMRRTYELPATRQPAKFRLLMLMSAGDLATNIPLDCLLEDSSVDLILHYANADEILAPAELPPHDALLVAISFTQATQALLHAIKGPLASWPKPVINLPARVPNAERVTASRILQGAPGVAMPMTHQVPRDLLERIARGEAAVGDVADDCRFPIIVRPLDSHAGHGLARIADAAELTAYLAQAQEPAFYVARFIDYSGGADGLFRKYRVALIAGRPFACHMAISSHWMIHYLNAGMYEDAAKRAEEGAFFEGFAAFAKRHAPALDAIYRRSGLDYLCIDCAETRDGELLVFEIDHAMVIHAMDSEALFPHKQVYMAKVKDAFENFLFAFKGGEPR